MPTASPAPLPGDTLLKLMDRALGLANQAAQNGDIPVGALVVDAQGNIVAEGYNTKEAQLDPTGHAEVNAIRQAAEQLRRWHLEDCSLLVTLEPCAMCAGAIIQARLGAVYFGAWDPKAGAAGSLRDLLRDDRLNHNPAVKGGIQAQACQTQLQEYFQARR
ncbi:tRNA adenosine(34) deaminase TadA [Boudabousia liubingyangii]|nr:tRNA adenosine(34) deaminase TadA [Boudabousia liubingyangii]